MDTPTEQAPLRPKRKYTPRRVCTDPELKYRYKPKPGPKPGFKRRRKKAIRNEPVRTDAEQRRFSRNSIRAKKRSTPETAAHLVHIAKTDPARVSRYGIPDGMNRAEAEAAWAEARARAEKLFMEMVDKGVVADVSAEDFDRVLVQRGDSIETILVPKTDEGKAAVALKELMVVGLGPMGTQQTKVAALNTVLKFTKSPPATKVEVSKAEDLLAAALADINKEDGDK